MTVEEWKQSFRPFTRSWRNSNLISGTLSRERFDSIVTEEKSYSQSLLRDIVGNPYRPIAVHPAWLNETVVALALAAYAETGSDGTLDNVRLGIIADALADAGCSDEAVMGHLRGPGPHYLGCHVVDALIRGRSPHD